MIGLFFGGKKFETSFGNQWGNVELDAALDEAHEWSAEVTSNPVEQGAPISDHIILQPDKLRIRGFVTDAPLNASSSITGLITSVGGVIGGGPVHTAANRTQAAFDLLGQLLKLKLEVTVYTKHRTYTDMVLTNVTVPRAATTGEALEFTAEFQHIVKVETQTTDVPSGISSKKSAKAGGENGAIAKKADPRKVVGKVQPETITPSSTLSRLFK